MNATMFAAVADGGALGAMTRYAVSLAVGGGIFGIAGPLATLGVNVVGSAIVGGFAGLVVAGFIVPEMWRGFVAVGFLGALTTFSSFALDTGALLARQGHVSAILYTGLSVGLSLTAFFAVQAATAWLLARGAG